MKSILIDVHFSSTNVAVVEDGTLVEFWVERRNNANIVGNVYKGKLKNFLPGMQASFVDIGRERNAFLYDGDVVVDDEKISPSPAAHFRPGDDILCQVTKDEFGTKGARITTNITIAGRVLVLMPQMDYVGVSRRITDEERRRELIDYVKKVRPEGCGVILRTQSESCVLEEIAEEMEYLYAKWLEIKRKFLVSHAPALLQRESPVAVRAVRDMLRDDVDKVIVNDKALYDELVSGSKYILSKRPDLYEYDSSQRSLLRKFNLNEQINALTKRTVPMKNGAYLVIDRTEALTIIDVNTGKYVGGKNLEETVFETNCIAAETIAKQLRARNIGGIIVIDFIDMESPSHMEKVLEILNKHLERDRTKTVVLGVTHLGLVEMTRKKTRSMLESVMLQECPYCSGEGHVFSSEHVIMEIREKLYDVINKDVRAVKVTMAESVCNRLIAQHYLSRECSGVWRDVVLYAIPDPNLHIEKFKIEIDNSGVLSLPDTAKLIC